MVRAYQRRHRFAMVAFRGTPACEVVEPTRGLRAMLRRIDDLPTGGATCIAAGLEAARHLIVRERRRVEALVVDLLVITDGRANRSLRGRLPLDEALAVAGSLRSVPGLSTTVVDAELRRVRFGLAERLAAAMDATLEPLGAGA
jgi:magnesium chelatase subunit D